ncbi:hypothetical protein [Endozoicomonas atrinae]|uniref:hypothetical protein n=1 Tax=Endozoicomonas atrinae TaxID=1333660 RepID=UPI003AFFFC78
MDKITGSTTLLHQLANDNEKISPVKWKTSKVEEADFYLTKCKDRLGAPAGAVYPGIGLIFVGAGLYLTINGILEPVFHHPYQE